MENKNLINKCNGFVNFDSCKKICQNNYENCEVLRSNLNYYCLKRFMDGLEEFARITYSQIKLEKQLQIKW